MTAPVLLSCFSRPKHLVRTVEALKLNTLATETDLILLSDGPKPGHEESVSLIRKYAKTIDGFRSIRLVERTENIGRVRNVRPEIVAALNKFGSVIYLEEDIVTAPGFLAFMNAALDRFYDNPNVISVSGFTPLNHRSQFDSYCSLRAECWGLGLWAHKYDNSIKEVPSWGCVSADSATCKRLREFGSDLLIHLKNESLGLTDALDIRVNYWSAVNDWRTVMPTRTLVTNSGLDGSGEHCPVSTAYDTLILWEKTDFSDLTVAPEHISVAFCHRNTDYLDRFHNYQKSVRYRIIQKINFIKDQLLKGRTFR